MISEEYKTRFNKNLRAAALLLIAVPAIAEEPPNLAGNWMHLGDPYGLVIGHIETLRIEPSGTVTVELYRHRQGEPPCETLADMLDETCRNPQVTERGTLQIDPAKQTLAITSGETVAQAFTHPRDSAGWAVMRAAGDYSWSYLLEGDLLTLSRVVAGAFGAGTITKRYHRVDDAMPSDLFEALGWMREGSILRASCAITAIQADETIRNEFRGFLVRIANVGRERQRLSAAAQVHRPDEEDSRPHYVALMQFLAGLEVDLPPGVDRADVETFRDFDAWQRENEAESVALYPGAVRALPEIESCLKEMGL